MIKLVCFDLDGVLVDACDIHKLALERAMLETVGYSITDAQHRTIFNGLPTRKKLEKLGLDKDIIEKINSLKQEFTIVEITKQIHPDPIKIEMLNKLRENFYIVCVTNSIKKTAQLMLERSGLMSKIDLLISNEDVTNAKPNPEGYEKAMIAFKTNPDETIIVEDSEHGIKAALDSGANLIKVKDPTEVNIKLFEGKI